MRTYATFLACIIASVNTAQFDVNKMIQQKMAKGQGSQQGSENVKVEDDNDPFVPNTFIGSFRMESHFFRNGIEEKNSPSNMRYWSTTETTLIQTEVPDAKGQDMKILTDLKGKWQYMLMTDDQGKKTAMKSRKKKVTVKEDPNKSKAEVTVTTETRTIDGHTCKKVVAKSEEGAWTGWVTEDIPAPFNDMARNVKGNDPEMTRRMSEVKGFPLEFQWDDANGKDRMVSYMKEVVSGTVDESVFSLDGYEVTEMPGFGQ
jgi:GLPGLI family protein